jgi:RHS repeat-associated protein
VADALGETWDDSAPFDDDGVTNYTITYAKDFRYDGGRQRYRVREYDVDDLNLATPEWTVLSQVFTDYDGDQPLGDFTVEPDEWVFPGEQTSTITEERSYELNLAVVHPHATSSDATTEYYHQDMLGTTRTMSDDMGDSFDDVVYTAFGQPVCAIAGGSCTGVANPRYGYAGAWGYQSHEDFPFLHLGARYYDPSTGRFLQRDPIGIKGGANVYEYAFSMPGIFVDPAGRAVAAVLPFAAGAAAADGPLPFGDIAAGCLIVGALVYDGIMWFKGPSGKPKVHIKRHPTRKRAEDAARREGDGKPVQHKGKPGRPPHFHPSKNGKKKPHSPHHIW